MVLYIHAQIVQGLELLREIHSTLLLSGRIINKAAYAKRLKNCFQVLILNTLKHQTKETWRQNNPSRENSFVVAMKMARIDL